MKGSVHATEFILYIYILYLYYIGNSFVYVFFCNNIWYKLEAH